MSFRYAILGSGRQGTAAAYDLARFGEAESIILSDLSVARAEQAALRVNQLIGRDVARAACVDVQDADAVVQFLRESGTQVFISGVPFYLNLNLAHAAIRAGVSMCDFGGHTAQVRQQLALDGEVRSAGITLLPDCGQVPGLGTSLCAYAASLLDVPRDVLMYDGGIPQHPQPPWHYDLNFNIEGLTNEYDGTTLFLREGKQVEIACFEEYELIDFPPPIGRLEAFTTAGGTSTMPWTYLGILRTLQNKTLRWPGHCAQWKAFRDAGLLGLEPIEVAGASVVPRQVLHAVLAPKLDARPGNADLVIIRVISRGLKDGQEADFTVDLFDRADPVTGFTAMERTTGWHAAMMAGLIARGLIATGGVSVERAVPPSLLITELGKRGFDLRTCRTESKGSA